MSRKAILIAGPTASGKSRLALDYAAENDGVIINVDSMQVYDVLNLLSSRPQLNELSQADHMLYGFVQPAQRFSTGGWKKEVFELLHCKKLMDRTLIFVGGTGLYFQVLTGGLISIPEISEKITNDISKQVVPLTRQQRLELLQSHDPQMAERLREPDQQRVIRALSVLKSTGRSLAYWQNQPQSGLLEGFETENIVLNPDRELLAERISQRFEQMLTLGAIQEVEHLTAMQLDPTLPVMKAIGVREIARFLDGKLTRQEMIECAAIATRQYAKRQRTWFRSHMKDWAWREN